MRRRRRSYRRRPASAVFEHEPLHVLFRQDAFRTSPARHAALEPKELLLRTSGLVRRDHLAKQVALAPPLALGQLLVLVRDLGWNRETKHASSTGHRSLRRS